MFILRRKQFTAFCLLLTLTAALMYTRARAEGQQIVIDAEFEYIRQGTVGVVKMKGPDIAGGVVSALNRNYPFFPTSDGFAALIAVPLDQKLRKDYSMVITIYRADGTTINWDSSLRVELGEFVRETDFVVPRDRIFLLNMGIQVNEDLRMRTVYGVVTPSRFWEGRFTAPVNGKPSSPFGSVRTYNDGSTRRHLGFDFSVPQGTAVQASASGRVVFARGLDIRGNAVIIDHGWGVFSNYSHMRDIYVVPGQYVLQGQVIGLSGNTGRSTGPHVHWEVAVNGVWVNPVEFAATKLPQ